MTERTVLVVSPEGAMGHALLAAVRGLGVVATLHEQLDHLAPTATTTPSLAILHVVGQVARALGGLGDGGPIIAVLPRGELGAVVDLLQACTRVVGVIVSDGPADLDAGELTAMVRKLLADDAFGLAKVMPNTPIHTHRVRHYEDKRKAMAAIAAVVAQHKAARGHAESIDQAVDEMLMNALYHAPVDATGKQVFAGVPVRERVAMRTQQTVLVEYACDGKRLAVAVRDAYGSLQREVVLRYLYKCLHSSEKVDRKAGGAGLGLYLMLSSSSAVYFHLLPGVATEAICVFDFDVPKRALESFACIVQRDARGMVAAGPAVTRAASPKRKILIGAALLAIVALVVGGIAMRPVLFPDPVPTHAAVTFKTSPPGATIEIDNRTFGIAERGTLVVEQLEIGRTYSVRALLVGHEPKTGSVTVQPAGSELLLELRPVATVELDSKPQGATVTIGGTAIGTTPLSVTTLAPGSNAAITFEKVGYRTAIATVAVPPAGHTKQHVQPLEVSDDFVRVRMISTPPGAEVVRPGAPPSIDHTYTPAELFVEAGKLQRFLLTMPKHVPALVEFTPAKGKPIEKTIEMKPGVALRVESARGGKATVVGTPHCVELAVPFDCTVAAGRYVIEHRPASGAPQTREVTVGDQDTVEKFD